MFNTHSHTPTRTDGYGDVYNTIIIINSSLKRTTTNSNCIQYYFVMARRKTKTWEKNYPVGWNGDDENDVTPVTVLRAFGNCLWGPRFSSARGVLSLLILLLLLFLTADERTHPWWLEIAPSMCWGITVIAPVRLGVFHTKSQRRCERFGSSGNSC